VEPVLSVLWELLVIEDKLFPDIHRIMGGGKCFIDFPFFPLRLSETIGHGLKVV